MSRTLKLTPTDSVTIRRSTPELLEVEAVYGHKGNPPPKHLHPSQDEHFEVMSGTLRARIAGEERTLERGATLDVPRGTVHQMWNAGDEPARVIWQTRPAGRTEQWFASVDALHREGHVGRDGTPGPLAFGPLLSEYRDVFRLAAGPAPLMKAATSALGAAGRARGYRPPA